MAITLRAVTGSALTHDQVDVNFSSVFYSASLTGQELTFHKTGSAAIGQAPTSTTFTIPSASKWTDVPGGIARNSNVQVTGSFSSGNGSVATGIGSHAEGNASTASGEYSHAEGNGAKANGTGSHAEGTGTATGNYSHAEGAGTTNGTGSHAEGGGTATGNYSHAEGGGTANGNYSHAEGGGKATGNYSHAEGSSAEAVGDYSHAEGTSTKSQGTGSHAEGFATQASGLYSHAEGDNAIASGTSAHAEGLWTIAQGDHQHVQGRYNISSANQSAFIIGNGINSANRSNLVYASGSSFQVTGSVNVAGTVYTTGDIVSLGNITAQQYIVSTSVYYVTESYNSGSHIFGNTLDDTHQFTGSLLVTSSIILKGTQTITGSLNILGTQTVNGAMTFASSATLSTPDTVGNNSTNNLTIQGNQGLILSEANGNVGQIIIGNAVNNSAYSNYSRSFVKFARNWNAISGSSNLTMNALHVSSSIDFVSSSGTNIARGLYIDPTLTGVSDYRAIEVATGSVVINGNTTVTGSLRVTGSTTFVGTHTLAGSNTITGVTVMSGSVTVASGSDFYYGANKQYNYGAFQNNTTLSGSANVSWSFQLDTVDEAIGVSVVSGSRVTFANNGTYNMQFSAQLDTVTAATIYIWFKKNGVNIPESATRIRTANNDSVVPAWNFVKSFSAGDYVELAWQSSQANTTFPTIPASGNVPICPSVIFTVAQIR